LGLQVEPDVLLTDVTMDMTALIFIGGGGSSQYVDDPTAHRLIWEYYDQGKIVGAICIAPIILATAGILKGRRATVFGDGIAVLKKHGAHYTGSEVEVDTRIITGRDVGAAHLFGTKLLTMMTAQ
jgi:protease I